MSSLLYGWLFFLCSIFYAFVAIIQESLRIHGSVSVCLCGHPCKSQISKTSIILNVLGEWKNGFWLL